MSACGAPGGARDRLDASEHAAGVPGREGSDEPRRAVELDAAVASGRGPGELAGVPLDEGFGFRRDVEILVEAGVRLADLGFSVLDQEPVQLRALAAGEVEAYDDASIGQPVPAQRVAHRPQGHERIEVLGSDLEPAGTPLAERRTDLEEVMTGGRELVVAPVPGGLGADSTILRRSSCLSRSESNVRDSPGAPSRISPKLPQPRYRLRMITGVQRSAKISAPRAIGQYWPYVLMTSSSRTRLRL